jgi:hypothetical protein
MPDIHATLDPDLPAAIRVIFIDSVTGAEAIALMDFHEAQELILALVELLGRIRYRRRAGCDA